MIYAEQVGPDTSNFLIIGPDSKFKIYGSSTVRAKMNGMNGLKANRVGKSYVVFKDGIVIEYTTPEL